MLKFTASHPSSSSAPMYLYVCAYIAMWILFCIHGYLMWFSLHRSYWSLLCHSHRSQNSKSERKRKRFSDSERLFSRSSVTSHAVSELDQSRWCHSSLYLASKWWCNHYIMLWPYTAIDNLWITCKQSCIICLMSRMSARSRKSLAILPIINWIREICLTKYSK